MRYTLDIKIETNDGNVTPQQILERIGYLCLPAARDYQIEKWSRHYERGNVSESGSMKITTSLTVERNFGPGAVIEDSDGERYVKSGEHKWQDLRRGYVYSEASVVSCLDRGGRVLSEGVQD